MLQMYIRYESQYVNNARSQKASSLTQHQGIQHTAWPLLKSKEIVLGWGLLRSQTI